MTEPEPRCVICEGTGTLEYPVLPGLYVYLRAAVPMPVCLRCLEALADEQRKEPASLEAVG